MRSDSLRPDRRRGTRGEGLPRAADLSDADSAKSRNRVERNELHARFRSSEGEIGIARLSAGARFGQTVWNDRLAIVTSVVFAHPTRWSVAT